MAKDQIDGKLKKILLDVLQTEDIWLEDSVEPIGSWDSMAHIEIMLALEKNYSIRIEPEKIVELTNVRAIQDFLESKGVL